MFDDVDFHDPIVLAGMGSFALGLIALACLVVLLLGSVPRLQALRPFLPALRRNEAR